MSIPYRFETTHSIAPVVEQYRKLLGEPNNGNDPAKPGGRREINWDGVPDEQAAPAFLPADFFKARGARLVAGGGPPKDPALAAYWFRKSAERGDSEAQFNLGLAFMF